MWFRITLWGIEARIACFLVAHAVFLHAVPILMIANFPYYLLYLRYFTQGISFWPVAGYGFAFAAWVLWQIRSESDDAVNDRPVPFEWERQDRLARFGKKVASEIGCAVPNRTKLSLSPTPWRWLGCEASGIQDDASEITIPLGCLAIWSVLDLSCYLAHRTIRRCVRPWLFGPALSLLARLNAENLQNLAQRDATPKARQLALFTKAFAGLLIRWQLVADIEADIRIAKAYGGATVADWIQRSTLATISVPLCLGSIIEPAAKRARLLPVAEACRAWHMKIEPPWKDSLMNSMRTADRSGKPAFLDPLIIRLGALQRLGGPSAVFDPRPAAGLIEDLASWEERVLRNEVSDLPHDLHRAQIAEIGTAVVLPQMQEEVARNAALLQDWDVSNLPELLQHSSEMADGYCADPRFLLARPQREFMMSQLFSAFLATELVKLGWLVGYSVEKGILLHGVQREINPDIVIRGLASGKMSRDEFLSILADGPIL